MTFAALVLALCPAQDLDGFEKVLRSGGDPQRREVVQKLAAMRSVEAWELLIGALADEKPRVADEAQLQLREMPSEEVLELALGKHGLKSRKPLVRLRVAEALGRIRWKLDPELFARPLGDKEAAVRRALYWSLQRTAEREGFAGSPERAAELLSEALEDEEDPGARAAAVVALGACAGPGEELIRAALEHEQAQTRAAGVLVAAQLEPDGALQWIPPLSTDPDPGVRAVVAEALAEIADPRAALALVWHFERETDLRRKWRVVELLQAMSGKKHRLDPRPWRDWADGLPLDWKGPERQRPFDHGEVSSAFAGLPILSDRVAFLIDLSGSIWTEELPDGRTRKDVVDVELRKALESLPPDARFALIPYTRDPLPWEDELVEASEKNVSKALKWFEKRKDFGVGNFWDALLYALEDPEVDTIVSLSDGAPSGGHRWNMELMKELYREHNRFRRVPIDAILVDRKGWLVEQWKEMCAVSGGRVHQTELK